MIITIKYIELIEGVMLGIAFIPKNAFNVDKKITLLKLTIFWVEEYCSLQITVKLWPKA